MPSWKLLAVPVVLSVFVGACAAPLDESDESDEMEEGDEADFGADGCQAPLSWRQDGPHTLGFLDGRLACEDLEGRRFCVEDPGSQDYFFLGERYGLIAKRAPDGSLEWRAAYAGGPVLCRAYCSILHSRYEVAAGNPFCDDRAELLENGRSIALDVHRATEPGKLAPMWELDWAYGRSVLAPDEDAEPDAAEEAEPDEEEKEEDWWPPRLVLREPGGGAVDVERALTGLVLRLDVDSDRLPDASNIASAIVHAGRSRSMAARLREMVRDVELDGYNRARAGAVLVGILAWDPELSGKHTRTSLPVYMPDRQEAFLLEGVKLMDAPESKWPKIVGDALVGNAYEAGQDGVEYKETLRESLESLRPDR